MDSGNFPGENQLNMNLGNFSDQNQQNMNLENFSSGNQLNMNLGNFSDENHQQNMNLGIFPGVNQQIMIFGNISGENQQNVNFANFSGENQQNMNFANSSWENQQIMNYANFSWENQFNRNFAIFSGENQQNMNFGNVSGEDHLNQHSNQQFNSYPISCPNCDTNFGEMIKQLWEEVAVRAMNRVMVDYLQPLLQNSALPTIPSSSLHQAEPSASRSLLLKFIGSVPDGISTFTKIEDKGGSLEVELVDEFGKRVEVGPESCLKIKIDVLKGDFDVEDKLDWTDKDYNENIAKPRNEKGSLLMGKSEVVMTKGAANVSHLKFTDNSSTRINKKFRLGARVVKGLPRGVVVKTAVSEAFRVKERRQESYLKHKKPSLRDDIWRLDNIRKDGPVHERAVRAGICTVKDLLQRCHTNPEEVQRILHLPQAKLKDIFENAEACKLPNEHYRYDSVESGDVLMLDCVFNIISVKFKGQNNKLYEELDDFQKEKADKLRRSAYENKSELTKIDDPMKQTSIQEFTSSSVVQGQEQQLAYPCVVTVQAELGEPVNRDVTTLKDNPFQGDGDPQLESQFKESANPPQQEWGEGSNVSQVAAHNHVSKLLAVYCVTKAASLFMIKFEQDPSAPNKKQKLQ